MTKDGWIKLHRKLLESDIFCSKPPEWLKIWIYILLSVNFDDGNLPRGTGYFRRAWQDISSDANSETKITEWQWHNCIRFLKKEGMITTQKTTRGMRLNVLRYHNYQIPQPTQSNTENKTQARRKQHYIKRIKECKKEDINHVFAYWQKTFDHSRAKLTQDRKTKIAARLRDYSLDDLKRTIDGCKASAYHMGENDQGKVYDTIELLFRNGDKVESFWEYAAESGAKAWLKQKQKEKGKEQKNEPNRN